MENKNRRTAPFKGAGINLSDFALFLSVMKNKEAYEAVLSIILDEADLELTDVKVEEVVLNLSGCRAIRLDAWARDSKNRQFNTEMQNDTDNDDVRRRARYYQGLLDSPVLKAGKDTRYKNLPSSIIIFITQDDIFGRDQAKYTFTEQCEEIPGFPLGDGTKKIFLNMSSKEGKPELISLLQYMKETRMDNPGIIVQDVRLRKLDSIVSEVKQSEEWEAVQMSIWKTAMEQGIQEGIQQGRQRGMEQGIQQGMQQGIQALTETCQDFGVSKEDTIKKLAEKFLLEPDEAEAQVEKYWDRVPEK